MSSSFWHLLAIIALVFAVFAPDDIEQTATLLLVSVIMALFSIIAQLKENAKK